MKRLISILSVVTGILCFTQASGLSRTINVAVIETRSAQTAGMPLSSLFKEELTALFKGEHQVHFKGFPIGSHSTDADAHALLDKAYADPDTDLVLVLDLAANQALGRHPAFAKPTFLPMVFNAQLLGYPLKGSVSGKKNLHYESRNVDLTRELAVLARVAPFDKAALISDARIFQTIGRQMQERVKERVKTTGVDLTILPWDGDNDAVAAAIPTDTDAVLYGAFPSARPDQIKDLIQRINKRKLKSFSLSGETLLRMGVLATNNPDTDWKKLARKTAIRIQEVFLGTPASTLPVFFKTADRLMINLETARGIGFSPGFDVLGDAVVINEDKIAADTTWSLGRVARTAVETNLTIAAQRLAAQSAEEAVNEAKGAILPRISSSVSYLKRKKTDYTRSGNHAEDSADGTLTLTQPLFSEKAWAAYAMQKYAHLSEQERLEETELDIVLSAVNAYLNVLLNKTSLDQERYNLKITRENYELAQNRVNVGSSNASDLFRWESELANAKNAVLSAKSRLEQQRQVLNRILDRPISQPFATTPETLDNPLLFMSDFDVENLITNPRSLSRLTDFFVQTGMDRAPELKQLKAQMAAYARRLRSDQRAFWIPELNLTGEYTRNFDETRDSQGIAVDENDWTIGLELTLPLYEGGARSARRAQSRLAVSRLRAQYKDTANTIEQEIRSAVESLHASYDAIDLTRQSEAASQKNYALVSAAYAQGRDSIVEVLDAQDALMTARESSMNAVYTFLIDLMNLQRSTGAFDFFFTHDQRKSFISEVKKYINPNNVQ